MYEPTAHWSEMLQSEEEFTQKNKGGASAVELDEPVFTKWTKYPLKTLLSATVLQKWLTASCHALQITYEGVMVGHGRWQHDFMPLVMSLCTDYVLTVYRSLRGWNGGEQRSLLLAHLHQLVVSHPDSTAALTSGQDVNRAEGIKSEEPRSLQLR